MIEHIVLFAFKPEVKPAEIDEILQGELDLANLVPGVVEATAGADFSGRAAPFTHGGRLIFADRADLATFYPHPAHQAFRERLMPLLDRLLVFDYEAKAAGRAG